VSLQDYVVQTRDLIRDTQGLFVTPQQLTQYINEGRTQVAMQTGCVQRFITGQPPFGASAQAGQAVAGGAMPGSNPQSTFATIPNQERYPFVGYANQYLQKQHRGVATIIDVVSIAASWGGAFRPALTWLPWEEFQAQLRATQILVTNYPLFWSVFNDGADGEVWVYPPPQSVDEWEWIVFCEPAAIYKNDDYDAIPHPFQRAVKYYAAKRAYEASQRFYNAELMMRDFERNLVGSRGAVDRGKVPTYYPLAI
jgi:hypothetical protein